MRFVVHCMMAENNLLDGKYLNVWSTVGRLSAHRVTGSRGETRYQHVKAPFGSDNPSMYDLTPTVQQKKIRPQHRDLRALLFVIRVWVL